MKLKTKDIGLIGLLVACTIALNLVFYYAFFFVFLLILFLLDKPKGMIYAFVYTLVNFVSGPTLGSGLNVLILPFTMYILYGVKQTVFKHKNIFDYTWQERITFGIVSALIFLISNMFYVLLDAFVVTKSHSIIIAYLPYVFLTALVNPLLFTIIGYPIIRRIQLK